MYKYTKLPCLKKLNMQFTIMGIWIYTALVKSLHSIYRVSFQDHVVSIGCGRCFFTFWKKEKNCEYEISVLDRATLFSHGNIIYQTDTRILLLGTSRPNARWISEAGWQMTNHTHRLASQNPIFRVCRKMYTSGNKCEISLPVSDCHMHHPAQWRSNIRNKKKNTFLLEGGL